MHRLMLGFPGVHDASLEVDQVRFFWFIGFSTVYPRNALGSLIERPSLTLACGGGGCGWWRRLVDRPSASDGDAGATAAAVAADHAEPGGERRSSLRPEIP